MNGKCSAPTVDPRILARLNCPLEEIAKLCEKFGVTELSVFGSVVRDDFRDDGSDIDFLYVFNPNIKIGYNELFDIEEAFSKLVGRKIDFVSKKWMGKRFEQHVLPIAQVIYAA